MEYPVIWYANPVTLSQRYCAGLHTQWRRNGGRQGDLSFWWTSGRTPILHALFSSASGDRQPMRICRTISFALEWKRKSFEGECSRCSDDCRTCAAWVNSALNVGSQLNWAAESAEFEAHTFERHRQWCCSYKHPSQLYHFLCFLLLTTTVPLSCKPAIPIVQLIKPSSGASAPELL